MDGSFACTFLISKALPLQRVLRSNSIRVFNDAVAMGRRVQTVVYLLTCQADLRPFDRSVRRKRGEEHHSDRRKREQFLKDMRSHYSEYSKWQKEIQSSRRRLLVSLQKFLVDKQRRGQDQELRQVRDRIRALREDKMDEYLELLKATKNEALIEFVRQTDEYMLRLGAKIMQEKGVASVEEIQSEGADGIRERYYAMTHQVREAVVEQPKMLRSGELRQYQMEGLNWLVSLFNNNLNGILADEMGLGKTLQSISLLCHLIETKKSSGPFLVVAPLSTLRNNWRHEFRNWAPSIRVLTYDGPKDARRQLREDRVVKRDFTVLLTTYEFAMKDANHLRKINWKYIVVDEAHRLKNPKCKLSIILNKQYCSAARLALTGTPLQNDIMELWSLLNFLHPSIFDSCESFEEWFNKPFMERCGGSKAEIEEEERLLVVDRLHKVLRPFILRREKAQVEKQLPSKIERILICPLSAMQAVTLLACSTDPSDILQKRCSLRPHR